MAFEVGNDSNQPWVDPPAHRIGVDVMHLSIPDRFTFQTFVETVGDAVRKQPFFPPFRPPSPPSFLRDSVIPFRSHPSRLHVFPKPGARNDWLMIWVSSFYTSRTPHPLSVACSICPMYIILTRPGSIFFSFLYAAYAIREGNPEPNSTRFTVRGILSLLSYLDAQRSVHESVGVGTRVRLQTDRVR